MAEAKKKKSYRRALTGLREKILTGDLATGERVPEVAISVDLGVSRTPLREAMSRLVEQGLLERIPSGGCLVRSFTRDDVAAAIELRGTLEGLAFRLAAERGASHSVLTTCERIADAIDAVLADDVGGMDLERYGELNDELHATLAGLCRSDVVLREVQRIAQTPMAGPSAFLPAQGRLPVTRATLRIAQDHHRMIIDAIRHREGTRAEALAREHARLARRTLDVFLRAGAEIAGEIPGMALIDRPRP